MRPRWTIAKKEFVSVFAERTIVLAVIIQVFVAGFSSFLVVGLSALVDPAALPGGMSPEVAVSNGTSELTTALRSAGLHVDDVDDSQDAYRAFQAGRVDAAILVGETDDGTVALMVVLPDGDLRATLTLVRVKAALEDYERQLRDERSERLQFEPIYVDTDAKAGSYGFVYALLIPLLVFLPVVLAGALTADSLTEEVQRGTLPLLLASPAAAGDVVEGKLLANVALVPILSTAWFFLLALNDLTVPLGGAIAIIVLGTSIAYLMGLLACGIALATRDRNKAHVIYATALFFALTLSLALPVSPVNAVALFAAGSPSPGAYALTVGLVVLSLVGWGVLRVGLRRTAAWMAAGGA